MDLIVGPTILSHALDITDRRIRQLVGLGMPRATRGKYDFVECVRWYLNYLSEQSGDLTAERTRLIKAQADLAEVELLEKARQLISLDVYEKNVAAQISAARQRFLTLPARVAPQLEGEDRATIKVKLHAAVCEILSALAKGDRDNQPRACRK